MTQVARRYRLVFAAVCLIYGTSLLHPPRLNGAEPLTIAVIGVSLMSTVLSLFTSGADPTAERIRQIRELNQQNYQAILQNHKLIGQLHERFDNFGKAMEEALHKLDALPEIMRKELRDALDEFQQARVLGIVDLIVEDFTVIREGGELSTDPRDRLRELQTETRTLMKRGYLNAPLILVGMAYEIALLKGLGKGLEAEEIEIEQRTKAYQVYFRQAISETRQGSIYSQFKALWYADQDELSSWQRRFRDLQLSYHTPPPRSTCAVEGQGIDSGREGSNCHVGISTWFTVCTRVVWSDIKDELHTLLNSFRKNTRVREHREEIAIVLFSIAEGILKVLGQHPAPDLLAMAKMNGRNSPFDPYWKDLETDIRRYVYKRPPSYLRPHTKYNSWCCPPCY